MTEAKAAAGAIGPIKFYDTLAQAQLDVANLSEGDIVEISEDEELDGARSRRKFLGGALALGVNLDQLRIDLSDKTGSSRIGFNQGGSSASVKRTIEAKIREIGKTPQDFGAKGDGINNDTASWNLFQNSVGPKSVPPGQYLVDGVVKRFDQGCIGNGEFDGVSAAWDQPVGDRQRDSILVHRRLINADSQPVSPVIKTQTHINFKQDVPSGSFKHVVGAYHEATYDGYYNTKLDTNQNFTVSGSTVLNRMAGLFGGLAHIAYCEDVDESINPLISTMGATKNGCSFLRFTRRAKYRDGGYMFGQEVYCQNEANETDSVAYQNNDEFSFTCWTAGYKIAAVANGAPVSAAIFTHGLSGSKHGFWNGFVIGGSGFKINGDNQGVAGTVGLNLASWRSTNGYGDIGIKFRTANRHLYFREGAKVRSSLVRLINEAGASGLSVEAGSGFNPYIHLRNGATSAPDGGAVENLLQIDASATRVQILANNNAEIHLASGGIVYAATTARFAPGVANDGVPHLGGSNRRFDTVYAKNSAISTSDERAKQSISDIEIAVLDAWGDVNYCQYQMNDAVVIKGPDGARIHFGVIAQRVKEAFEKRGLDPFKFGPLCYDEWDAANEIVSEYAEVKKAAVYERVVSKAAVYADVVGDDGVSIRREVTPEEFIDGELLEPAVIELHKSVIPAVQAGNRYGIRYEEALCLEAAYQRRRADRIEDRLAALESRFL